MAKALHAIDYLGQADKHPPQPVCAVFGDDSFLRRQVLLKIREMALGEDEGDFSLKTFEGPKTQFRDVAEEVGTVAMFGGRRMVIVEEADEFVTAYRDSLEKYVEHPSRTGVLVLELKSLPSNTRLYKAIDAKGLAIDCSGPTPARLNKWLSDWAKQTHGVQLPPATAEMLVDTIGAEVGLLDQEIAKLALMATDKKITPEMVTRMVGGWRARTTWEMLDAAMDGNAAAAIQQLDRLLSASEVPISILGQISASLRRMAAATRLIIQAEAAGRRVHVGQSLESAGVKPFVLARAEKQLRRLGRQRGSQLYRWLLEADLDLKGDSAMPPRLILERLIIRLAAPQ